MQKSLAEAVLRLTAQDMLGLMRECGAGSVMVRVFVDTRGVPMCSARIHAPGYGLDAPRELVGIREEVPDA